MTAQRCGQIYKPFSVGDDASSRLDRGLSYGSSSFASHSMISYLVLIRLWLACTFENLTGSCAGYLPTVERQALQEAIDIAGDIASGKTRAPALIPESARAAEAPKIMLSRRSKRILARGLPACRQYGWFRFACNRTLNGNQFFEFLGRMSIHGRASVYRLEYRLRLCQRRLVSVLISAPSTAKLECLNIAVSIGLSPHHLWPD